MRMHRKAWTKRYTGGAAKPERRQTPRYIDVRMSSYRVDRRVVDASLGAEMSIPDVQVFDVDPVPKPRMTQRDRWTKRPCVLRYRAYADALRLMGLKLPRRYSLIFIHAMPKSWSEGQRKAMNGQPKLSRPDTTNLLKAVEDIAMTKDEALWDARGRKYWGYHGRLVVLRRRADFATELAEDAVCPDRFLPSVACSKPRTTLLRRYG